MILNSPIYGKLRLLVSSYIGCVGYMVEAYRLMYMYLPEGAPLHNAKGQSHGIQLQPKPAVAQLPGEPPTPAAASTLTFEALHSGAR